MQQPSSSLTTATATVMRSSKPALSRTSSMASLSSDDVGRRTRKRFTSVQLVMLEQLYHRTSHPSREEREAVAQAAGMEMKSVTIWFQNKRQTERKVALHHTANPSQTEVHRPAHAERGSTSSHASSSCSTSLHSPRLFHSRKTSISSLHQKNTPPRSRPSLDRVATQSESRLPPPRTPTKPRDPFASPWDNMPSSPLAPPASPPVRDLVEFMGNGRTLEWACAVARIAEKEGRAGLSSRRVAHRRASDAVGDETEEEDIEAVTPEGSLGFNHIAWSETKNEAPLRVTPQNLTLWGQASGEDKGNAVQDDDMMRAALALCGLGRRQA
ncbi:homeobox-domain-containing protein [Pisolithus orientalis]|uniref:homeobox-domain-containing protein n=1 Tax=Pisolithus orientalis TaxID=936130 RepID=UPI0022255F51|nr:homeobox-domain-containing protein [Pisolithus orientalis]KAI6012721.1 homeobox-domain-containing protein [Pisolithus orientalis]